MDRRLELHAELVAALGSSHVYYQPPPTVKMVYPCIVYQRDNEDRTYADNHGYLMYDRYQVTVIDRNPDSVLWKRVLDLPMARFSSRYIIDGLHHDVLSVYV